MVRRRLRDYGLGLGFGGLFLLALIGQAFAGPAEYNEQQSAVGLDGISLWGLRPLGGLRRRRGRELAVGVPAVHPDSVWFVQRGSPEGEPPEQAGRGTDEQLR